MRNTYCILRLFSVPLGSSGIVPYWRVSWCCSSVGILDDCFEAVKFGRCRYFCDIRTVSAYLYSTLWHPWCRSLVLWLKGSFISQRLPDMMEFDPCVALLISLITRQSLKSWGYWGPPSNTDIRDSYICGYLDLSNFLFTYHPFTFLSCSAKEQRSGENQCFYHVPEPSRIVNQGFAKQKYGKRRLALHLDQSTTGENLSKFKNRLWKRIYAKQTNSDWEPLRDSYPQCPLLECDIHWWIIQIGLELSS